jgi:hypothetical protein
MQTQFSWKGFKIALVGVCLALAAICINTNNSFYLKVRTIMMVTGILTSFYGIYMHNKELFTKKI